MKSDPQRLRAIREGRGHTRVSLAKACGVSQQRIADLEAAPAGVRPPTALALAKALDVDISAITDAEPLTAAGVTS